MRGYACMGRGRLKPVQRTYVANLRNPGLLCRLQPAHSTSPRRSALAYFSSFTRTLRK
jgi:hypothetical protein